MTKIWSSRAKHGQTTGPFWWLCLNDWVSSALRFGKLGFDVLIPVWCNLKRQSRKAPTAHPSLLSVRSQLLRWVLLTVDRDQHGPVTLYNFGRWPCSFGFETVEEILHLRQLKPINKTEISAQDWRKGSWLSLKSAPSASPTEIWLW